LIVAVPLPIDPRTILRCNRRAPDRQNFHHFDLQIGIIGKLKAGLFNNSKLIQISINVDGIPLSKSSLLSFWPILSNIVLKLFFRFLKNAIEVFIV